MQGGKGGGGSGKERHQVVAKPNGSHRSVDNVLVGPVGEPEVENVDAGLREDADDDQGDGQKPPSGGVFEVDADDLLNMYTYTNN